VYMHDLGGHTVPRGGAPIHSYCLSSLVCLPVWLVALFLAVHIKLFHFPGSFPATGGRGHHQMPSAGRGDGEGEAVFAFLSLFFFPCLPLTLTHSSFSLSFSVESDAWCHPDIHRCHPEALQTCSRYHQPVT